MNCDSVKIEIKKTSKEFRHISYSEKKSYNDRVNNLLESIDYVKKFLLRKIEKIDYITSKLEQITWYSNLDDECLEYVNEIIALIKELHSASFKAYTNLIDFSKKGIAKEEIKSFKSSLDDLKETVEDVESVFFELPHNKDFQEINIKLSNQP